MKGLEVWILMGHTNNGRNGTDSNPRGMFMTHKEAVDAGDALILGSNRNSDDDYTVECLRIGYPTNE